MDCRCYRRTCICCGAVFSNPFSRSGHYHLSPSSSTTSIELFELGNAQQESEHNKLIARVSNMPIHLKQYAKDDTNVSISTYRRYEEKVQHELNAYVQRHNDDAKNKRTKVGIALCAGGIIAAVGAALIDKLL